MAIFGTLFDRTLASRAGDALTGITLTTLAHSLPATNPEIMIPVMRSVQAIGFQPHVTLLGLRGNASLNTIGFVVASTASCPALEYEVVSAVLHSIVR